MSAARPKRELFDDEHEAFRESFGRFLEGEVIPVHPEWEDGGVPREVFQALGEHGFVAMQVPEELGGAGIDDFRFNAVLDEELMRANLAGLALMLAVHNDVCLPLLVEHSREDPRAAWLPGLAAGELIAALASADPAPRAERRGDGWLVSGEAPGVVNGGIADLLVTVTETGKGPLLVVVEASAPGVRREPAPELVGPRIVDRAELRFEGVEVPDSAVLEEEGADLMARQETAQRLSLAVLAVAGARAALAITLDYVRERRAFGQPIASFQNTRYALADVVAELDASEAFVDACVGERNAGRLTPHRAASAKLRATEIYGRTVDWGVQLHGGYGYMLEYPIAHAFAAARFLRLHGGTSEAMKDAVATSLGI
jgi:alkylation response protein AidB-like acyl-CoA dehydrogenase